MINRKRFLYIGVAVLGIVSFYFLTLVPRPVFKENYSTVITDRNGEILRVFLSDDGQWCFPPDTTEIPDKLKTCVLNFEDKRFYYHFGVDPIATSRALYQNITQGRVVSGSSTITMQVARMSSPSDRTILNKISEMFFAIGVEMRYSKDEILKLYLDHAPYGGNIRGYTAAGMKYFGKKPERLTWAEAATLAVLPNSPSLINPVSSKNKLKEKRDRLLEKLEEKGKISKLELKLSKGEKIPDTSIIFPFVSPHLSRSVYKKNSKIETTIDKNIQEKSEKLVSEYNNFLKSYGVNNVSLVVCDTQSGEVLAYVGSGGFFDTENGQVDGVIAPRSTGSLLKPFLFALCQDEGMISRFTKIPDIEKNFGGFSPKNANKQFAGMISAKDALIHSLNVPFVILLQQYGVDKFYDFLKDAGSENLFRNADGYGLPLILGGAEMTLLELTGIYASLGRYGVFSTPIILKSDEQSESKKLISDGSCYETLQVMRNLNRPGHEHYWQLFRESFPISWKTGTSFGGKDGWSIGVTPQFTIGVWTGNFTGEGNPNIGGARTSAPLMFQLFNNLSKEKSITNFSKDNIPYKLVHLCKDTGYKATSNCTDTLNVMLPHGNKLYFCTYHKKIFVDIDDSHTVCSLCWESGNYKEKKVLVYPPSIAAYLRKRGEPTDKIPLHNPKCPTVTSEDVLKIVYPENGAYITLPLNSKGERQNLLIDAAHVRSDAKLYWYIDESYYKETEKNHQLSIKLSEGNHKIFVVDDEGKSVSISFDIGY